jgi:hypothetical protein
VVTRPGAPCCCALTWFLPAPHPRPAGETLSEGGFAPNRVSAASLLDASTTKDKKGKTYYNIEILTRTGGFV